MPDPAPSGRSAEARPPAGTPLLRVDGAGRYLDGDQPVWIWRNIDLTVAPGERLGLAGPSGSGKTLLLRALAGLDPLTEGRILLDDRPLDEWWVPEYRARVMYLPQRPAMVEGSVEHNLRAPFDFQVHADKSYDGGGVAALLGELGRDEAFLRKRVGDLSGGERQIAALVRALQLDPAVLLLDEPDASMDEGTAQGAEALVGQWLDEQPAQRAVVWTSHHGQRLDRVAERWIEL